MMAGMKRLVLLLVVVPTLASAQSVLSIGGSKERPESERRAIERCEANRGVDCGSRESVREWSSQDRPISDAERTSAAAARRHREEEERRRRAAKPVK